MRSEDVADVCLEQVYGPWKMKRQCQRKGKDHKVHMYRYVTAPPHVLTVFWFGEIGHTTIFTRQYNV